MSRPTTACDGRHSTRERAARSATGSSSPRARAHPRAPRGDARRLQVLAPLEPAERDELNRLLRKLSGADAG